jgi:hypothetical protein
MGQLRHVQSVEAISPGYSLSSAAPEEVAAPPAFMISSNLFSTEIDYGGQAKFTIFVYEVMEGEVPVDALNGVPFAQFDIVHEQPPVPYPASGTMLVPGHSYIWFVRAHLRGPTYTYLDSKPLYFRVAEQTVGGLEQLEQQKSIDNFILFADDYERRLYAALKIIMRENYELFISGLQESAFKPVKGHIRWNGQPFTLEELEELAKKFREEKCTLTRVRFQ